jgi:hypothetical protein
VLARQPIEGEHLSDVRPDQGAELMIGRLPPGESGREIAPGLREVASVVELPALARGFTWIALIAAAEKRPQASRRNGRRIFCCD